MVEGQAEGHSEREPWFEKECETKDDGRYIIFYTFASEEREKDHSDGEDVI